MATATKWTPFGVALNVTATAGTVTRTSATAFTVTLNVSWKCYWSGNKTNYGMSATSGGVTKTISAFGTSRASGSSSFTGTYSISGYGAQTKSITVTFKNFNTDNGNSATKTLTLNVSVPAWPSYKVSYNANGGSGAPSAQTKYKNVALTLSGTKPTRTGYNFSKWNTASGGGGTSYNSGGSYTANAAATLYAQWTAKTFTITFNANGGDGGPGTATKTYNSALTLPTTVPTRANHTFLGWAESSTATEATYEAGGSFGKNITANTTLYAVWKLAYYAPVVKNVSIDRCGADGTLDDFGSYIKASFAWECCQLLGSNPVASIKVGYKTKAASDYTYSTVTPNGTTSGTQSNVVGGSLSVEEAYDVRIVVTDSSSNSPNYTNANRSLASAAFVIDFLKGGKGVAIGKVAETEGLDVAMDARFRKSATVDGEVVSNMTDTAFNHVHPATGARVGFGVGSGGTNRGVWDDVRNGWLIHADGDNNVWAHGDVPVGHSTSAKCTLASGFSAYGSSEENHPTAVRYGNVVTVSGVVTNNAAATYNTTLTTMFTVPSGYRPSSGVRTICNGTGYNKWMLSITPSGTASIQRYGSASAAVQCAAGSWLPFTITYVIE